MKKKCISAGILFYLIVAMQSKAQLFIQGNSILIQSGATVHIDGLTLTAFAINLIDKEMTRFEIPIVGSPHANINRVYKIDSKTPFTGKIGMRYQPSELNGNDENLLQLSYRTEDFVFTVPTNKSIVDLNNHYIEEEVVNQELWAITATTSGSFLPVKLIDFKCMLTDELVVSVTWSTSEETNSDHFEIQHSINGKYWSEIGRVKAGGESNATRTYAFEHSSPVKGDNLYRLKMVDQDGTYAYSRMRNVHYGGEGGLTFHPNPVVDRLSINARDWPSLENLKIINVSGAKVAEFNYAQLRDMAGKEIDFKKYPSGVYIISITRNDGTVQSEKIIKN